MKPLATVGNFNSCTHLGYAARVMMSAWIAFRRGAGLGSIQTELKTFLIYKNRTVMIKAIGSREEGYAMR